MSWALREDKPSGAEGQIATGITGGTWQVNYTIYARSLPRDVVPTERWSVVDEFGRLLKVEGVFEKDGSLGYQGPSRMLILVCERTGT